MCGLVNNIWQLAVLRVLCGIGLGGEQPMGGTFVAEEWPEDRRKMGAGYMHTGLLLRLLPRGGSELLHRSELRVAMDVHPRWGRRPLLVGWIQSGRARTGDLAEEGGQRTRAPQDVRRIQRAVHAAVSGGAPSSTRFLFTVSIIGLWAGSNLRPPPP